MNRPIEPHTLEEVLDAYVAASERPSREILQEWIKRYPQFSQELTEFTIAWSQTEHFPKKKGQEKDPKARIQIGMEIARQAYEQAVAAKKANQDQSKPPILSFFREGRQLGFSSEMLAQQLNLPVTVLSRIENRFLLVDTIPDRLIESLAQILQRTEAEIRVFLSGGPVVPQALRLKSHQAPKISQQQIFFDIIRTDNTISEEQRAYWLSFEKRSE